MLGPEKFQQLRETRGMEHDGLMLPAKIADTYYHVHQQHRSAWEVMRLTCGRFPTCLGGITNLLGILRCQEVLVLNRSRAKSLVR